MVSGFDAEAVADSAGEGGSAEPVFSFELDDEEKDASAAAGAAFATSATEPAAAAAAETTAAHGFQSAVQGPADGTPSELPAAAGAASGASEGPVHAGASHRLEDGHAGRSSAGPSGSGAAADGVRGREHEAHKGVKHAHKHAKERANPFQTRYGVEEVAQPRYRPAQHESQRPGEPASFNFSFGWA